MLAGRLLTRLAWRRAAIMKLLNDHKQLGEKTGAGFYKFDAKRKASPNKDLAPLIAESRKVSPAATCSWGTSAVQAFTLYLILGGQACGAVASPTQLVHGWQRAESGARAQVSALQGIKPPIAGPQDIIEFIFFPVVNEGCRVISESIVDKPADLDVATVMAMGFPAYR